MKAKQLWQVVTLSFFLIGCMAPVKGMTITPLVRELSSPKELPESLTQEQIYWQKHLVFLNGTQVENDSFTQLMNDMKPVSGSVPEFSHQKRYLAYEELGSSRIFLWDLITNEKRWLIDAVKDFPYRAKLGDFTFTPDDDKVIFSYIWADNDQITHSDLATVDIETGIIESLHITSFQSDFFELNISADSKWLATNMVALNDQVCLLISMEERSVKCLTIEKGWYHSTKFLPDLQYIVYTHRKEINSPTRIMISKIDGTETRELASGFVVAEVYTVSANEIIFGGTTFDNPKCGYIYVINEDGSDLRKLSYMGENCLVDNETIP